MCKLRVWHIPQVGMDGYGFFVPVGSVEEGKRVMDILVLITEDEGQTFDMFLGNYPIVQNLTKEEVDGLIQRFREMENKSMEYICPKCGLEFTRAEGQTEYQCVCGLKFGMRGQ